MWRHFDDFFLQLRKERSLNVFGDCMNHLKCFKSVHDLRNWHLHWLLADPLWHSAPQWDQTHQLRCPKGQCLPEPRRHFRRHENAIPNTRQHHGNTCLIQI